MIPVGYHISDVFYDYNPDDIGGRFYYYPPHGDGQYYLPYAWIDGIIRGAYSYNSWWNYVNSRTSVESPITITLSGEYNPGIKEGDLDIEIYVEQQVSFRGLALRVALTEDSIYYRAPNGTLWHNFTTRDMIPDADGEAVSFQQGNTYNFTKHFSCPEPLRAKFCRLVVWVQADASDREVLQAASIELSELDQVSAIDDPIELPESFSLAQNYPNPFNARTNITYQLDREGQVELAVYDLLGQKIKTLVSGAQAAGNYQVNWDGTSDKGEPVGSGVYFYKLDADGVSQSKQMMLIK